MGHLQKNKSSMHFETEAVNIIYLVTSDLWSFAQSYTII